MGGPGGLMPNVWITPSPPSNGLLVASATAEMTDDDEVTVTFDNLLPCEWFYVDLLLHYEGSIPAKVSIAEISSEDEWLLYLWSIGEIYVLGYESDEYGTYGELIECPIGMQLHECDYILIELWVHIPQSDDYMNLSGEFTGTIEVIQWNEYGID
jgi:hypothetical protein